MFRDIMSYATKNPPRLTGYSGLVTLAIVTTLLYYYLADL